FKLDFKDDLEELKDYVDFDNDIEVSVEPADAANAVLENDELRITADELPLGEDLTIKFTGKLNDDITPGQTVTNAVEGNWTGLPKEPADKSNPTGTPSGDEREYEPISDSAEFTTKDLTLDKAVAATSESHMTDTDVAIGEVIRYRLTVDLPEGTIPNLEI